MIITRKHLSRRTLLRGMGAALALPLLDGMVPALSAVAKTAAGGARRMAVIYTPNGMMMPNWTPKGEGTAFEFSPILEALTPFRKDLVVISGLADKYDVPSAQIRALNNLTRDDLQLGQKLRIPARSATGAPTPAGNVTTYTVKAGDTALGIALQFDTTVEALERANGVAKGGLDTLQLGQVVKLPPPGQR